MNFFAITQKMAEWVLAHPNVITALHKLLSDRNILSKLSNSEIAEGSIRIAGSKDNILVASWHEDYVSGTGEEAWGFIKISPPFGIFDDNLISREVFERCLYIINQRLQNLLIDSAYIHRPHSNGVHTCLAGRGEAARQLSIGFTEGGSKSASTPTLLIVGPSRSFDELISKTEYEAKSINQLCDRANTLISPLQKKPILNHLYFQDIKDEIAPSRSSRLSADFSNIQVKTEPPEIAQVYRTLDWTYEQWCQDGSPLSVVQRRILYSDGIKKHPIRISGPGGSGKTLLLQLMAIRILKDSAKDDNISILYIAHNAQMAEKMRERFKVLIGDHSSISTHKRLHVTTLSELSQDYLDIETSAIIDNDADKTKEFQLAEVKDAIHRVLKSTKQIKSKLIHQLVDDEPFFNAFSNLAMKEISIGIKGHGLNTDKRKYVESAQNLTRLHGLLNNEERNFLFSVFEEYNRKVFEGYEVLDSDDVAISLLLKLKMPIMQLKRRSEGYDFIFVDEAQLFNENEKRIFPLLAKTSEKSIPVALALDEAQEPYALTSSGLGLLGFDSIQGESLPETHRSIKEIVDLAFFMLQRTTDLFNATFPNYTSIEMNMHSSDHALAAKPSIMHCPENAHSFGKFIVNQVRKLRKENIRQICIVCHSDSYWDEILNTLTVSSLPFKGLLQRGDFIPLDTPIVVLTKPGFVGGQEFDAVIAVGLEKGISPPHVNNEPFAAALEQQCLREMYLTFTRARFRLLIAISNGKEPNNPIQSAYAEGFIENIDN